jgi:hypothetical protein
VKSKRGHRHGKGPAPEVGDYVQWTSHGVDQFNPARKVRQILDRHAWVDGSQTGIPISEVTVAEPPAPILVAKLTAPAKSGPSEAVSKLVVRRRALRATPSPPSDHECRTPQ